MESSRWNELLDWIAAHPLAAGLVIFLIAFCDALLIIGVVVPAAPLLFAVLVERLGADATLIIAAVIQTIGFAAMLALVRMLARA